MRTNTITTAVVIIALLAASAFAAYRFGLSRSAPVAGSSAEPPSGTGTGVATGIAAGEAATRRHIAQGLKAGQTDPANGRPILYYQDPMVPGKRFDAPAKSPFMDMMLVPVYGERAVAANADDANQVTVNPRTQQNLGVRTADVVEGTLQPQLSAVGSIAYDERDQSVLQARAAGFVEKLHVRATLDRVTRGQPIADLVVPEWVAAQEEFLALRRVVGADDALVSAARQRMRLVGMSDAQIARVAQGDAVQARMQVMAPSSGVVAELAVREGMSVAPGMTLARINGLSTVWAMADLPEAQVALVKAGAKVDLRSAGVPGTVFHGTVDAVLPAVDLATRTVRARIVQANPGTRLLPGMFVTLQFASGQGDKTLLIPTEALIQTGRRSVVLLAEADGRFRPVDVEAGVENGGLTEIRRGLTAGQRVVVSSQFLIDSEASLKGVEARLNDGQAASGAQR